MNQALSLLTEHLIYSISAGILLIFAILSALSSQFASNAMKKLLVFAILLWCISFGYHLKTGSPISQLISDLTGDPGGPVEKGAFKRHYEDRVKENLQ